MIGEINIQEMMINMMIDTTKEGSTIDMNKMTNTIVEMMTDDMKFVDVVVSPAEVETLVEIVANTTVEVITAILVIAAVEAIVGPEATVVVDEA